MSDKFTGMTGKLNKVLLKFARMPGKSIGMLRISSRVLGKCTRMPGKFIRLPVKFSIIPDKFAENR